MFTGGCQGRENYYAEPCALRPALSRRDTGSLLLLLFSTPRPCRIFLCIRSSGKFPGATPSPVAARSAPANSVQLLGRWCFRECSFIDRVQAGRACSRECTWFTRVQVRGEHESGGQAVTTKVWYGRRILQRKLGEPGDRAGAPGAEAAHGGGGGDAAEGAAKLADQELAMVEAAERFEALVSAPPPGGVFVTVVITRKCYEVFTEGNTLWPCWVDLDQQIFLYYTSFSNTRLSRSGGWT